MLRTGVVHIVPCKMVSLVIVAASAARCCACAAFARHRGREKAGKARTRFSGTRRRRSPCSTVAIGTGASARRTVTGTRFGRRPTYFGKGSIGGKRWVRKSAMRGIRPEGSRALRPPQRPRFHRATDQARQLASTAATSAPRWRRWLRAASILAPSWLCSLDPRSSQLSNRLDNCASCNFHCAPKLSNCCRAVTILPRPQPACLAGTFTTASRTEARIASQGGSHDPDPPRSCSPPSSPTCRR
jgi:hypothetical protein